VSDGDDSDVIFAEDDTGGDLRVTVAVLQAKVRLMSHLLRHDYVTRYEFNPVKLIVYGITAMIITAVMAGLLALIVNKS